MSIIFGVDMFSINCVMFDVWKLFFCHMTALKMSPVLMLLFIYI